MRKLVRQPLNELAYQEIKNSLAEGYFKPMQPLIIRTLAANYGISASPVREALQRLVAERLLVVLPNRSIVVPLMTRSKFHQLYCIRGALEGLATELATPNFRHDDFDEANLLLEQISEATRDYDSKAYLRLNRQFHFLIYGMARNPELVRLIEDQWLKVGPVFNELFNDEHFRRHANDEHINILAAIRSRHAQEARTYMERDLNIAAASLMRRLPETTL